MAEAKSRLVSFWANRPRRPAVSLGKNLRVTSGAWLLALVFYNLCMNLVVTVFIALMQKLVFV